MQASLNLGGGALPTEGSDKLGHNIKAFVRGSPLYDEPENIIKENYKQQITKSIPLEWHWDVFSDSVQQNMPLTVIYKDFYLGKKITIDNEDLNLGEYSHLKYQVIDYETLFYTPVALSETHIEIPTGYLPPNFNRFFEINAEQTNLDLALNKVHINVDESQQYNAFGNTTKAGGIVISTSDLNYAMGVYINYNKCPNTYFRNWKFGNCSKWSAGYYGKFEKGLNSFRSYVIVGTLDDVRVAIRMLCENGY